MDEVQKKVCRITDIIPNCLSNRRILQSGLSDILADDRLHLNLLMAAYDENIVGKLSGEKDSTVAANYLVRQLHNSYGFHNSLCVWTVVTWLFILKRDDEAVLLFNSHSFESEKDHSPKQSRQNPKQEQLSFFCTNCGNRFSGQEKFCGRCGKERLVEKDISTTNFQNNSERISFDENQEYFCPSCWEVLNSQPGFNPNLRFWTCKNCGAYLFDEDVYSGERFKEIFWFCDKCNSLLNTQDGFRDLYDYWKCTKCSHINHIAENDIKKSSKSEPPELPSILDIKANTYTSETELILSTIDYYKETGRFPDDDFIRLHKEMFFEISRSNYQQRYGAFLVLGECYLHGIFGKKFIGEKALWNAILCFEESIKSPIPITEAEIELLNIHCHYNPDYDKSLSYCKAAVDHGDPTGAIYFVRDFLIDDAIENGSVEPLSQAVSLCMKAAAMNSVPQYRSRIDFLICCYICAVMGQIISIVINDKRARKSFDKLTLKIKNQIQIEYNYNVLDLDWFEDNVSYLLEVFELTPKQLKLIDLTDKQRREWSS